MPLHPSFRDFNYRRPIPGWCNKCYSIYAGTMEEHQSRIHFSESAPPSGESASVSQPNTEKPVKPSASEELDRHNKQVADQAMRLAELHEMLIATQQRVRLSARAFEETLEYKEHKHHLEYLIDRCRAAKYELDQLTKERSEFLAKTLNIDPNIDIPLLAEA